MKVKLFIFSIVLLECIFFSVVFAPVNAVVQSDSKEADFKVPDSNEQSIQAAKASKRLLMDIKRVANNRLIAVGERGHILISDNQGDSWKQVQVSTEALLTKLFFIDQKVGWAVGHQQTILKTIDAGSSWRLQNYSHNLDQPALFDIWFKNKNTGFAVGAYGLYLKTSNGGQQWEPVYQEKLEDEEIGFPHFYSITYNSKNNQLFMAGELGFLASSVDEGNSWAKMPSPYDGSFFNITSLPGDQILVMGLRGHLFKSNDQGNNWSEISTGTLSVLQELLLLDDEKYLIVGGDGTQLIGSPDNDKINLVQRPDRSHLASAIQLKNSQILLVGINGVLSAALNQSKNKKLQGTQ